MADLNCDVLVVGGGVTGIAAATAAARNGASTMLIEARPFVGGNGTTGLCLHNYMTQSQKQVVFGIAQEVVDRLIPIGGAVGHIPYDGFVSAVTPVDGDLFRIVVTEMLAEAGVQILYGTLVVGVEKDDAGNVTGIETAMKGGTRTIRSRTVIDASGDADVAALGGARFRVGELKTGSMQPVSMLLHFIGVDTVRVAEELGQVAPAMATKPGHPDPFPVYFDGSFAEWNDIIMEEGIFPNRNRNVFFNTVWPNRLNVNTSAVVNVDGTDPLALSKATVELTKQCARIGEFMKEHIPGFDHATYVPAVFAGVRQTRNIEGLYEISDEDVLNGHKFDDTVGQVCFPVDIHDPLTSEATFHQIGDDGAFDIPYRAMVPNGLNNVLVAGRCISASHFAHGATRNMAPCLVGGQAAGVAAALSVQGNTAIPDVDIKRLQQHLLKGGAYLGERFVGDGNSS